MMPLLNQLSKADILRVVCKLVIKFSKINLLSNYNKMKIIIQDYMI